MNRLMIETKHHYQDTVMDLLRGQNFIELHWQHFQTREGLAINYPDDGLGHALVLWLDIAKVCGLISGYTLVYPHRNG